MQNAGFKMIDRYEPIVLEIIDESARSGTPLEVGLYRGEQCIRDRVASVRGKMPLNVHFNHKQYAIIDLGRAMETFEADMKAAKTMGADYGIQHISSGPMTRQAGYESRMFDALIDFIAKAERLCDAHDFDLHLENTYEPTGFYRTLFDRIKAAGFRHIHYCFDLGHAKVWSGETFPAWMDLLDSLQSDGFRIHFHLHANQGLGDEHLSFVEMEQMGFDGDDGVFSDTSYAQMLRTINERFAGSRKVFEVKPRYAFDNLAWVRRATLS